MTPKEIRNKIDYEIIVDCYEDHEVNMGWYYFFENTLEFPFEAEVATKLRNGNTAIMTVDVLGLATNEGDFDSRQEIAFQISPKKSEMIWDVGISKLKSIKANIAVRDAFEIWNFWESGNY